MTAPRLTARRARSPYRPPPGPVSAVVAIVAMVAMLWCGTAIGLADPATPTAPTPPVVTTPAQPTPTPATTAPGTPTPTVTPAPSSAPSDDPADQTGDGDSECGVTDIEGCVANAVDGFFLRVVDSALNPLLELLGETFLATPEPSDLPRVGELWNSSWQLVLAIYGLLVMVAGILLMLRETLQTRWSLQELLPRLIVGLIAGAMSMLIATQAISFANGLAMALAGDGVDTDSAAAALKELATIPAGGQASSIFVILLLLALIHVMIILAITYVVRVMVTIVLVVAAPLALMCHALPGLDGIARWWWRAFAACLAIQVVQSLVLVTALRVFLSPGGWEFFGPNKEGYVNLIIALALMGVLIKVPFWLLSAMKISNGRSLPNTLLRGYISYKTFGLIKGAKKAPAASTARNAAGGSTPRQQARAPRPTPDPYSRTRSTSDGQLMLPLEGVRRAKPKPPPPQRITPAWAVPAATPRGEQMMLPLPQWHGVDLGPQPRVGRDGQYRLPINAAKVPRKTPPPVSTTPPPSATRARVTSAPTPSPSSVTRARITSAPTPSPRRQGRQLAFDFRTPDPDPYAGIQPLRDGQYPLPIPVRRARPPTPEPPRPAGPATPPGPLPSPPSPRGSAPTPRSPRPPGRQLHLPLPDLPIKRRNRRTPPPSGDTR
ncbi:hypothetical protein ACFWU5_27120 [Nocardia sp. NPDC058640]|uniref:hypothetical protein n=1 Tax=Nocardia sp. NPDC058640 TaxID=3346571 RepID=UPI003646CBB5